MRDYDFTVARDSTIPEGRLRILKRVAKILAHFPNGVPDEANCFFHGLNMGWVLSHVIGHADADKVDELLPPRPDGEVMGAVPYGPEDVEDPEFASLTYDEIPDNVWFQYWMGIKKCLYFSRLNRSVVSERLVFAWLGFLLGELEGGGISTAEYDKLRALLPPVQEQLTPLVIASR